MTGADWLHYALARLGWPGAAGLLLLAAAGLLQALAVEPLHAARATLAQRSARLAQTTPPQHRSEAPPAAPFSATLPGAERMPEAVARLFAAARHAGLSLQQGAYRPAGEKASRLLSYQISLPVSGDYPAVRAFVAEVLEREPSLALAGLRLLRSDMNQGEIEAELRFTLYLGGADASSAQREAAQ